MIIAPSGAANRNAPHTEGGGMEEVQAQMKEVLRLRNELANDPAAPRRKLSELQTMARENIAKERAAKAEAARVEMLEAQALADERTRAAAARAAAARQASAARRASAGTGTHHPAANASGRDPAAVRPRLSDPSDTQDDAPEERERGVADEQDARDDGDDRDAEDGVRPQRKGRGTRKPLATRGYRDPAYGVEVDRGDASARETALVAHFDKRLALTQQSIERVAGRAYSGVAAAMAMPNLTPREPGGTLVAAGAARYRCGSAFAAGATYRTRDGRWLVHAALAFTDRGDTGVRTHVGYEF